MQNVKGTADFVGSTELERKQVWEWLTELFRIYDFSPMETAVLNEIELLGVLQVSPEMMPGVMLAMDKVHKIGVDTSSLAAGGRYDAITGKLAGDAERDCPAIGLSFGLKSMMAMLGGENAGVGMPAAIVLPVGDGALLAAARAAEMLRRNGICTWVEYSGRKLTKALSSIAKTGIRYVLLIGPEEIAAEEVRLKDLSDRSELSMPLDKAVYLIEKTEDRRLFSW